MMLPDIQVKSEQMQWRRNQLRQHWHSQLRDNRFRMRMTGKVIRYHRRESGSQCERTKDGDTVASKEHGRRSSCNASVLDERLSHSLDIVGAPLCPKDLGVFKVFPDSQGYIDDSG
jgi:hypothetical protein